ncbi:flagellar basal body-associated protein FliL [Blastococcus sp. SYSU D00922]
MLALTPAPLQTAGERALFGELTRWDTGASVRAAVVAALPLIDGPLGRRISDAVLLVPEGIAVIRIAEVLRQSGVVKAVPEGAWTIAPESGPGQALQLSGGGSTPLDGLMRAGMEVAMKLRRAGLEPGRIARLTVLVGEVTGLMPADGDLGEGDLVSLLETRSLLLGIARASRYSGVDNPRLWTTADVRAALEALELPGRGPSVEELNGEGFPYSPYVLRRPELLTPAALGAPATAAPAPAQQPATAPAAQEPPAPPVREQPSPEAIAAAVAASAAAGHAAAAQEAAAAQQAAAQQAPAPVAPPRDTVAIDEPPAPPDDGGGIGGLFAGAEPEPPTVGTVVPPRTAAPPTATFQQPAPPAPPAMPPLYWDQNQQAEEAEERAGSRGRVLLMTLVGVLVVAALGVGGWFLLRDGDDGGSADAAPSAPQTQDAGPAVGDVQVVGGAEYRVEAVQVDETCVSHAYGDTADFFTQLDCTGLSRALYSTQVDGAAVVVAVSRVQMPDAAAARNLQALTDRNGSGNVSDLLREGVRYTGSPDELSGAEYASAVSGPAVTIVESAWVDEDAAGGSAEIDAVAEAALSLATPPFE